MAYTVGGTATPTIDKCGVAACLQCMKCAVQLGCRHCSYCMVVALLGYKKYI